MDIDDENSRQRLLTIITILIIIMLPFMVSNLYYGYNDNICLDEKIQNYRIVFTMGTWMIVQGYVDVGTISIYLILGCAMFSLRALSGVYRTFTFILLITTLFRIAWFIVGAIMYWGYLWPASLCKPNINVYMFVMLIANIILILGEIVVLCMHSSYFQETIGLPAKIGGGMDYPIQVQEPRPYDYQRDQTYQQPGYYETGTPTIIQTHQTTTYEQPTTNYPIIERYSQIHQAYSPVGQPNQFAYPNTQASQVVYNIPQLPQMNYPAPQPPQVTYNIPQTQPQQFDYAYPQQQQQQFEYTYPQQQQQQYEYTIPQPQPQQFEYAYPQQQPQQFGYTVPQAETQYEYQMTTTTTNIL